MVENKVAASGLPVSMGGIIGTPSATQDLLNTFGYGEPAQQLNRYL